MRKLKTAQVAALALLVAACGAVAAPATLTPTPNATPEVISTRLTAQLTGQLLLVGGCLRVQNSQVAGQSLLLIFPPDFTASVTGQEVLVADWLEKKQFTWQLGDIVGVGGGEIQSLDPTLSQQAPATCPGPYWVVGGLTASATLTPTPAPTGRPGPVVSAAPTVTPYQNIVQAAQSVLTRAGPGAEYAVVGQLTAGQSSPVVGQSGQWWQLAPANGHTAWVGKDQVTFAGAAQTVPVAAAPPTPTPAP